MVLLSCNVMCHFGVLLLHIIKGGCNGIGAWIFNSILNGAIMLLFLNFYLKMYRRNVMVGAGCRVVEEAEPIKLKN